MSKAILITDMPNSCFECKHRIKIDPENYRCLLLNSVFEERFEFIEGKRTNCPLKPIPQKNKYDVEKYATVDYENNVSLGHYLNEGRNACIDEILGDN